MVDWSPELYLKFERERTQPVRDLVHRLTGFMPGRILDLGCGPGNSTAVLREQWPDAEIIGLDSSAAMLAQARKCGIKKIEWVENDANGDLSSFGKFDLLFSNATLQWLPEHQELLPRLLKNLNAGGKLAVQIPQFEDMPIARHIALVASRKLYISYFSEFSSGMHYYPDSMYYETLRKVCREVELWTTHYYHILENQQAIIDFIKSTGMRPYLDRLPQELHPSFMSDVLEMNRGVYQEQKDGKVLFIFKRFFFVAQV